MSTLRYEFCWRCTTAREPPHQTSAFDDGGVVAGVQRHLAAPARVRTGFTSARPSTKSGAELLRRSTHEPRDSRFPNADVCLRPHWRAVGAVRREVEAAIGDGGRPRSPDSARLLGAPAASANLSAAAVDDERAAHRRPRRRARSGRARRRRQRVRHVDRAAPARGGSGSPGTRRRRPPCRRARGGAVIASAKLGGEAVERMAGPPPRPIRSV